MQRFLVLGAVALGLGVGVQAAPTYSTYYNARFGYSVLYPSNLVSPRPESQNGDGRVFKSSDKRATLTVWGENNVFNRSLKEQMNTARRDWGKDKGRITYWKMGSGYYVLSGLTGQEIFYEKTVPIRGGFATILWQYPRSQKPKFDEAVTRTTRAFGSGRRAAQNPTPNRTGAQRVVEKDTPAPNRAKAPRVALDTPSATTGGY